MYHFRNLNTGLFVGPSQPEEKNQEAQRKRLEKMLPSIQASFASADIIGLVHLNDNTDSVDWTSPLLAGPLGGAVVTKEPDKTLSLEELLKSFPGQMYKLQCELKSDMAALHKSILGRTYLLQSELELNLSNLHKTMAAQAYKLQCEHRSKISELFRTISNDANLVQIENGKKVTALYKKLAEKPNDKTVVLEAGYDSKGQWIEKGTIISIKKPRS